MNPLIKKIKQVITKIIDLLVLETSNKNKDNILRQVLLENSVIKNKKVFDCFIFDNEIELLEIRLNEYHEYVDYFVIVEIGGSHTGNIKLKSNFKENEKMWEKYKDKIIFEFVPYQKLPVFSNDKPWIIEYFHRNYIQNILKQKANIGDIIILSDADELWNVSHINEIKSNCKINVFIQNLYYYYFNCKKNQLWSGSISYPFGSMQPQQARFIAIDMNNKIFNLNINKMYDFCWGYNSDNDLYNLIPNGGSHFSWILNDYNINSKAYDVYESYILSSFFSEKNKIRKQFENGLDFMNRTEWQHKLNFIPLDSLCLMPKKIDSKYSDFFKNINKISIDKSYEILVIHNQKCLYFANNLERLVKMSKKYNFSLRYLLLKNFDGESDLLQNMNINYIDNSHKKYTIKNEIILINESVFNSKFSNLIFMTSSIFLSVDAFTNLIKHHNGYNVPAARSINKKNNELELYDIHSNFKNIDENNGKVFEYINKLFEIIKEDSINYGISSTAGFFCISKDRFIQSGGIPTTKLFIGSKNYWSIFFEDILRNEFHMNLITIFNSIYYKF